MGRGLGTAQKWPLVYLKPLMFNPCTPRILWSRKMGSPQKCWQLHNASSSCLGDAATVLVSPLWWPPGPGACPTMLFAASSPWSPYLPPWDLPQPLVLPLWLPPGHSWLPAGCLLAQQGGSPQLQPPNGLGMVGGGERGDIGMWIGGLVGCEGLY